MHPGAGSHDRAGTASRGSGVVGAHGRLRDEEITVFADAACHRADKRAEATGVAPWYGAIRAGRRLLALCKPVAIWFRLSCVGSAC